MRFLRACGFFLSTIMMFLGIPLVGWGLSDLGGFFTQGPRQGYAWIILISAVAVGWQTFNSPTKIRGGKGRDDKFVLRQRVVRIVITSLLFLGLAYVPYADRRNIAVLAMDPLVRWIGVLLFALGMGLVFWSGFALGELYSGDVTLQEGHRLISSGPYRWLRHPRYTGGFLYGVGLSLIFRSWVGLAACLIFVAILFLRIKDEETLMAQEFGSDWESYCARTWRLIPFIY